MNTSIFFLLLLGLSGCFSGTSYKKTGHKQPPPGHPIIVKTGFHLKDIPRVDTKKQEIELDIELSMSWDDKRVLPRVLKSMKSEDPHYHEDQFGTYTVLPGDMAGELWMPDLYLDKTPTIRNPIYMKDASSVRLYKNGLVRFLTLLNFDTHCEMNFDNFPFERQICSVNIEPFDHPLESMHLKWETEGNLDAVDGLELYSHRITLKELKVTEDGEEFSRLVLEVGCTALHCTAQHSTALHAKNCLLPRSP
jgi:hypothetical protein